MVPLYPARETIMSNHTTTVAARFAAHAKPATLADLTNTTVVGDAAKRALSSALITSTALDTAGEAAEGRAIADAADDNCNSEYGLAKLTHTLISKAMRATDGDFQDPKLSDAVSEAVTATLRRHCEVRDSYALQSTSGKIAATPLRAGGLTMLHVMDAVDAFDARGKVSADDWYAKEAAALAVTHSKETVDAWRAAHERIARTQRSMILGFLACGAAGLTAVATKRAELEATVADTRRWVSVLRTVAKEANEAGKIATTADVEAAIQRAEDERAAKAEANKNKTLLDEVNGTFAKLTSIAKRAKKDGLANLAQRLAIIEAHAAQIGLIGASAADDHDPTSPALRALVALLGTVVETAPEEPAKEEPAKEEPADLPDTTMGAAMADALAKPRKPGRRASKPRGSSAPVQI